MAADPFVITARLRHVDADGRKLPGIPTTLRMAVSDVAGDRVEFLDYDDEPFFIVPPGPSGATGMVFEEFQAADVGEDTSHLVLIVGRAATELSLVHAIAANTAVEAKDRMQGLDSIIFGQGQRLAFAQA
jgi:hypothetical protein